MSAAEDAAVYAQAIMNRDKEIERLRAEVDRQIRLKTEARERADGLQRDWERSEVMSEEAKNFGAEMMLSQMVKAVESGGRFSDPRANDFVDAKARLAKAEAEVAACDGHGYLRERITTLEARLCEVVEALKVAREYVKATEGQLVTRPNIVTKDRELCDAALAAAQPKEPK